LRLKKLHFRAVLMIWQELIHPALFALIVATGFFDAVMDAITIQRIHMGYSPLRDTWHICKHLVRSGLVLVGMLLPQGWAWDPAAARIVFVSGLVTGRLVWDVTYRNSWRWFRLDETIKIRTGWKWLDKFLGFHW